MNRSRDEGDTLPQHHNHIWRPRLRTRCQSATELRLVDTSIFAVSERSSTSYSSSSSSSQADSTSEHAVTANPMDSTNIYENLSFPAAHRRWDYCGSEAEEEEFVPPRHRLPPRPLAAKDCQRQSSGAETENGSGGFTDECDASSALLSSHYFTQSDTDADELMAECDEPHGPLENGTVTSDDETLYRKRKNVLSVPHTMRRNASDDYRNIFLRFTPPHCDTIVLSNIPRKKQQEQQQQDKNNKRLWNKNNDNNNKYFLGIYHNNYNVGLDDDCCDWDEDCKRIQRKRSRVRTKSGGDGIIWGKQQENSRKETTATSTTTTITSSTATTTTKEMAARRRRKMRAAAGSSDAENGVDDDDDDDGDNDSDNSGEADDLHRRQKQHHHHQQQKKQQQQQQLQRLSHRKRSGVDKTMIRGTVVVKRGGMTATTGAVIKTTPEAEHNHRHRQPSSLRQHRIRPRMTPPRQRPGHYRGAHHYHYRLSDEDGGDDENRLSLNSDVEICTSPVLLDDFCRDILVSAPPPPSFSNAMKTERLSTGAMVATQDCDGDDGRLKKADCHQDRRKTLRTRSRSSRRRRRQKRRAAIILGSNHEQHFDEKKPMASTPYGSDKWEVKNRPSFHQLQQPKAGFVPILMSSFLPPLPSTLPPPLPSDHQSSNNQKDLQYTNIDSNFCINARVAPTNDYCNTYYYSGADSGCLEDETEPVAVAERSECVVLQHGKYDRQHYIQTRGIYNNDGNETEFMNISDNIYENLRQCDNAFVATTSSVAATERTDLDETLRETQQRRQSTTTRSVAPLATVFSTITQATATTTTATTVMYTAATASSASSSAAHHTVMIASSCCASSSSSASSATTSSGASSERSNNGSTHFPVIASPKSAARMVSAHVSIPDEPALYGRLVGIVLAEARRHRTAWRKMLDAQHQLDHVLCACHRGWQEESGSGVLLCHDNFNDDVDREAFESSCAIFCDRVAQRLRCVQSSSLKDYNQQIRKLQKVLDQLKASIVSAQQQLLQKQHCQQQAIINKENVPLLGGKTPIEGGTAASGGGGRAINKLFGRIRHIL